MEIKYDKMGERIKNMRISLGKTQEQIAEKSGIGTTHLSHIETGNTIPSLKTFVAIANALDSSTDELLCDSVKKADVVFQIEIAKILEDCKSEEIRIIADTVKALKQSIRERKEQ